MSNKTVLAIAHRLSTISKMDRIIVMDDGRIIEEGTHASLLENKGVYANFWDRQSGGFLGIDFWLRLHVLLRAIVWFKINIIDYTMIICNEDFFAKLILKNTPYSPQLKINAG